eukprot:3590128-Pyramimonas_sp.AAC.1
MKNISSNHQQERKWANGEYVKNGCSRPDIRQQPARQFPCLGANRRRGSAAGAPWPFLPAFEALGQKVHTMA